MKKGIQIKEIEFGQYQQQIESLREAGKINETLALLDEGFTVFPDYFYRLFYWKAALYTEEGETEKALCELRKGIERGAWWNPQSLVTKPELQVLTKLHEFQEILAYSINRFKKESSHSKWKLLKKGVLSETALFLLHWRGSNVIDFSQYWQADHIMMGFLQSSQLHAYHSFNWDDQNIAFRDIAEGYSMFKKTYAKDAEHIIIGGASQGAGYAIWNLLSGTIKADGFIVVIPAIKNLTVLETLLKEKRYKYGRGYMIIGEKDTYANGAQKLYELFQIYNFPCKLVEVKGLGHYFPLDFPQLLNEGIDYVKDSL